MKTWRLSGRACARLKHFSTRSPGGAAGPWGGALQAGGQSVGRAHVPPAAHKAPPCFLRLSLGKPSMNSLQVHGTREKARLEVRPGVSPARRGPHKIDWARQPGGPVCARLKPAGSRVGGAKTKPDLQRTRLRFRSASRRRRALAKIISKPGRGLGSGGRDVGSAHEPATRLQGPAPGLSRSAGRSRADMLQPGARPA